MNEIEQHCPNKDLLNFDPLNLPPKDWLLLLLNSFAPQHIFFNHNREEKD